MFAGIVEDPSISAMAFCALKKVSDKDRAELYLPVRSMMQPKYDGRTFNGKEHENYQFILL
ncbi:hypothetical protein [Microbulbifer hydrolyticus]|uniref:Uncharacterized protein n=1 Tax=Microbulbifer hydrolyticus TaxID=48074 RepID=A0ABX6IZI4_9GAMM|nr:hypothetical protein [Microbulbifer hydrolyticus]QHQ40264.1 hypothetical protein GTQ55_15620 [Microbulbifer hydrolyticus]